MIGPAGTKSGPVLSPEESPPPSPHADEITRLLRKRRRLAWILALAGLVALIGLAVHGGAYYLLDRAARLADPRDRMLRPSGLWGHGVGIAATLIMLANFLYPLRKRARWLRRSGPVPLWLVFHVSVGLLTPFTILFHAAFRFNNLIATFTYASLVIVVTTGLVGAYIYSMVPGAGGLRPGELADLERSWQDLVSHVRNDLGEDRAPAWLGSLLAAPASARGTSAMSALRAIVAWPISVLRIQTRAWALSRRLPRERAVDLRTAVRRMVRLRLQIEFFGGIKRLLAGWRFAHSLLAIFLVAVIIVHVTVSLAFGYRWIF